MNTTEEAPFDGGNPDSSVKKFILDNIWLPVVGCLLIVVLIGAATYRLIQSRRRQRSKYHYWAFEESGSPSKVELEGRANTALQRDNALLSCSFYLRSRKEYKLVDHLAEIGSRHEKEWFLVRHRPTKTDKLLSILPFTSNMVLPFNKTTLKAFQEICKLLQHPYILPVEEMAFQDDQGHVVFVQPCCKQGSLKDHIYSSRWMDHFDDKYNIMRQGLNINEVKTYGKQILEAMLYLKERGFPWHHHVHSGNVILEDGVCRLSGYENTLFGYPSRIKPLLKRSVQQDKKLIDVHSFGHVMFEMLMGEELEAAIPDANHYRAINNTLVIELLSFIFTRQGGEYPSLRKINKHAFFQGIWLPEPSLCPPLRTPVPSHLKSVLKLIKKGKPPAKRTFTRGNISRASSYGSLHSQASSVTSSRSNPSNPSEDTPLISHPLPPITGSDANLTDTLPTGTALNIKPMKPPKPKKLRKLKPKQQDVTVEVHSPRKGRLSSTVDEPSPRTERISSREDISRPLLGTSALIEVPDTRERLLRQQRTGQHSPPINGERTALLEEIRRGFQLRKSSSSDPLV